MWTEWHSQILRTTYNETEKIQDKKTRTEAESIIKAANKELIKAEKEMIPVPVESYERAAETFINATRNPEKTNTLIIHTAKALKNTIDSAIRHEKIHIKEYEKRLATR